LDGALFAVGTIILTAVLLPVWGIFAVVVSNLMVNILLTLFSLAYHLRRTTFHLSAENLLLLTKAFGLLCAGFAAAELIPNLLIRIGAVSAILVLMLKLLPRIGEVENMWRNLLPSLIQQGKSAFRNTSPSPFDELPKG
jgi:hypothetical protein